MDTWKISEKVIKSLPTPMIVIDNSRKAIIINKGFKSLFSQHRKTIRRGQTLKTILTREYNLYLKIKSIMSTIDDTEIFVYTMEEQTYRVTISKITDYFSPKYCILFENITPEDNIEELRRKFISNVAHELRTPLAGVSAHAELIAYQDLNEQEVKDNAKIIYKEVQRLSKMVTELLDITKYDQNKIRMNPEYFEIGILFQEISFLYEARAKETNINITFEPVDIEIYADYDRLKQVLINLIDNAFSYTNNRIEVIATLKNKKIRILVADNGIGLTHAQMEKIFERFYRTDSSRARFSGGTGLGLSIVKEIVDLHNGKVYVQSELEKGTEFVVEIPVLGNQLLKLQEFEDQE